MHPTQTKFRRSFEKLTFPYPGLRVALLMLFLVTGITLSERVSGATWTKEGGSISIVLDDEGEYVNIKASKVNMPSGGEVDGYLVTLYGGTWYPGDTGDGIEYSGNELYIMAGRQVNISNSTGVAGISVTFKNSGSQPYLDIISVSLDSNAGSIYFEGASIFSVGDNSNSGGLSIMTDGPIILTSGCTLTSSKGIMLYSILNAAVETNSAIAMEVGSVIKCTDSANIDILGDARLVNTNNTRATMGVSINGASIIGSSTSGANGYVSVTGFGAGTTTFAPIGVYIYGPPATGANITSSGGDVMVTGTGGSGTAGGNDGVRLDGGARISSGNAGKVTVDGTGGGVDNTKNVGVCLLTNSKIDSGGAGVVTVTGKGGNTTGATKGMNSGISVDHSTITSGGGNVVINGTGGGGIDNADGYNGADNRGVYVLNLGVIKAGGSGSVSVTGKGGNNTTSGTFGYNYGVYVYNSGSFITSEGGNVSVNGTGGGDNGASPQNHGVYVYSGGVISSGSTGSLTLTGTGGNAGGDNNSGIKVYNSSATITSGGGNVSVTGYGGGTGESAENYGIELNTGLITSGSNGSVTLNGTSGSSTGNTNHGLYISGTATVSSGGGNVSITGTSHPDASGWGCIGIKVGSGSTITAGGSASVTILGTGGGKNKSGVQYNEGVDLTGTITSNGGPISITGIEGSGADAYAIALWPGTITTVEKGGNITLRGNSMVYYGDAYYGNSVIAAHASNTVSFLQYTNGVAIDLGPETDPIGGPLSIGSSEFAHISGGTISIGDANSGAISLKTDIGGTVAKTDYTQVKIAGSYNLSGVGLSLSGSYTPVDGNVFTILTSTALTGTFKDLSNGSTTTFNGKTLAVNYASTAVTLTASRITWDGSESTAWNTAANWSSNSVPLATDNILIATGTNMPIVSNLTIQSGAVLTIGPLATLTVTGTLTNNNTSGGVIIQSDATGTGSLIVSSVAGTGMASAQRYMAIGGLSSPPWHLISSPVTGQTVSGFLSANTNIPTSGSNRAMQDYNESTNKWNAYYFNTGATGDITPGKGYCMLTGTAAAVTFTGTLNASTYDVATTRTGTYGWNCIGNPYTSAIKINEKTDANNFITVNSSKFDVSGSYTAIYVWDETKSIDDYQIINHASDATYVSNGQAFFVKTATAGNTFAFTPAMQVHQSNLALKSGTAPWPEIKLAALVNGKSVSTTIKFIDGTTKGLDVGYDAGIFRSDPSLALYTRLVENNGVDFALQCLPNSNFSGLIIPVGLDCKTGGEVVFSAETINLAADCKAILEDKLTSTFTDLSKGTYKVAVAPNSILTDRFRLYASTPTISAVGDPLLEDQLKAFAVRNTEIRITGEVTPNAVASLYDTTGKLILTRKLDEGSLNVIPTPGFRSGMYVLKVNDKGTVKGFKLMMRE